MSAAVPLILVVDDQPGIRRLIQELFRDGNYRVLTAAHGEEAIAIAARERPSVVLLDMKMPIMDGLETFRSLKRLHADLRVVMMTAVGESDRVNEALHDGAHGCINKPFDIFELRQLVQELLGEEGTG